jgi:hypothetical protein
MENMVISLLSKNGGQGDFDIYRVTFNEVESDYSVVIGEFCNKR